MPDTITIPPEALEAAFDLLRPYMDTNGEREAQEIVEDACLAMLRSWPGMGSIRVDQPIGEWCEKLPAILLPLTEPSDGK
jgi:hypothetical protein